MPGTLAAALEAQAEMHDAAFAVTAPANAIAEEVVKVRARAPALSASACTRTHAQMQTLPAYCEVQRWGQASHRIPESIPICVAHVTDARRPTRQRAYHCACSPSSVRWTSARTSSL